MKLKITSIAGAGDPEKERVVMKANEDLDLTNFAVFGCRVSDSGFYAGNVPFAYWFATKDVKKGDFVVLYTKNGTSSVKNNNDGTQSHFFYWRRGGTIWTDQYKAVLVHTSAWTALD